MPCPSPDRLRSAQAVDLPPQVRGEVKKENPMQDLIRIFSERGDLAHLALLLWAGCASAYALFALRELAASARRFDDFVRELARFNDAFGRPEK